MGLVKNYQHMMDERLSKPKEISEFKNKVYKNSFAEVQDAHQKSFYRQSPTKKSLQDQEFEGMGLASPQPLRNSDGEFVP